MAKGSGRLLARIAALALIALLTVPSGLVLQAEPITPPACMMTGSRVLVEERSALVSVDPVTGARTSFPVREPRRVVALGASGHALVADARDRWSLVPVTGGGVVRLAEPVVAALLLGRTATQPPPHWVVEREPMADAIAYRVVERRSGATVTAVSFPRRIELAASASSPDGRYFVHVQANNVASEVAIVDARTTRRRTATLPHDAPLAAFAISLTFSPDRSCLAISMEREGGVAPESWAIDLSSDTSAPRPVVWGSVLAWVAPGE